MLQDWLSNCVRQKLSELPKTLDETYERILKEIGKADGDLARRILQCLTVASRPLRVEELAEVLALDFEKAEGRIPKFNENMQLQDRQHALMRTCSSLITIVKDGRSQVVQFSHFSVKEFLTSDRLATPVRDISSFHILPEPAHAILAQACLAVLFHLDDSIPLVQYAAEHWVDHTQFENVSLRVEDGMQCLFDQSGPYFSAWLKLYDIDLRRDPWYRHERKHHAAPPLYYASLCGFRDLAEHLVVKSPQDVTARGGLHHSPLAAALRNRHRHVAKLLYQHGADIELASYNNRTLLVDGLLDAVQWLLKRGANVNLQQNDFWTSFLEADGTLPRHSGIANAAIYHGDSPLHLASAHDHFEIMQSLIQHGADVTARDNSNSTPLHLASFKGGVESVQLLIQHKADVNVQNKENSTPLHLVFKVSAELFTQHGAYVNARDKGNPMPLLSVKVSAETAQLFTQYGTDVAAQNGVNGFDLEWDARVKAVEILIRYGADVNARDERNSTPLHLASSRGSAETAQLFTQYGTDVAAQNGVNGFDLEWDARVKAVEILIRY